jgi:hypothetical protein
MRTKALFWQDSATDGQRNFSIQPILVPTKPISWDSASRTETALPRSAAPYRYSNPECCFLTPDRKCQQCSGANPLQPIRPMMPESNESSGMYPFGQ